METLLVYNMLHTLLVIIGLCAGSMAMAQPFVAQRYATRWTSNVRYAEARNFRGGVDTLRMDIAEPVNDGASQRPMIMWIHGGGFAQGSRADMRAVCERWAARGYVAVTISYRLGFYSPWPVDPPFAYDTAEVIRACFRGIQDVRTGLKFLVTQAQQYRIDTSRVVIGGASAGAMLALQCAVVDDSDPLPPALGAIGDVQRAFDRFPRPSLGSLDGHAYLATPLPRLRAVINIFGGLFDLRLLNGRAFVPTYSYHQRNDPVVPCGINKCYWGLPFDVAANYPRTYGSCALQAELIRRDYPSTWYETWIHEGGEHAIHNELAVDLAASIFCARQISEPTSVVDADVAPSQPNEHVAIYNLTGACVTEGPLHSAAAVLPDGMYAVQSFSRRRVIIAVQCGIVYTAQSR